MLKQKTIFFRNCIGIFIFVFVFIDIMRNSLFQYSYPAFVHVLQDLAILVRAFFAYISCFCFLNNKLRFNRLLEKFIYILILFATMLLQKNFVYFDMFFVSIFLAEYLDYRMVANTYLYSLIFSVAIIVLLHYMKVFPEYVVIREDIGRVRTSLGFTHPNTLGHTLLYISMLYLIVRENRVRCFDLILVCLISLWLYIYPNSVTSSSLLILMVFFIIVIKINKCLLRKDIIRSKIVRIFSLILIPILIVFLYAIIKQGHGREMISSISSTLLTRVTMSKKGIDLYGFHFFNFQNIEFTGTAAKFFGEMSGYFVIDCLYVYIFLVFGIIPGLFYFLYYIKCVKKSFAKNYILWLVLMLLMLFSLTEATMITFKSSFIFVLPMCKYSIRMQSGVFDTVK